MVSSTDYNLSYIYLQYKSEKVHGIFGLVGKTSNTLCFKKAMKSKYDSRVFLLSNDQAIAKMSLEVGNDNLNVFSSGWKLTLSLSAHFTSLYLKKITARCFYQYLVGNSIWLKEIKLGNNFKLGLL